jgi:hypothetical protein
LIGWSLDHPTKTGSRTKIILSFGAHTPKNSE